MQLIEIEYGTDLHKEEIKLRDEVLRAPLGLKFSKEDLSSEKNELRYGLLDSSGRLTACLLIRILSSSNAKLRQMAVIDELRGKGIGRELVQKVETELKKINFTSIELNARMYAKVFYEKLGYTTSGNTFTEVGISHVKMVKEL